MTLRFALTVAGSDPSGGAGIQADLKVFAAASVYGLSVLTAVTVQNSLGVSQVAALDASLVQAQLAALIQDYPIHAIKTGMLASAEIVHVLSQHLPSCALVIDPVMHAGRGAQLTNDTGQMQAQLLLWPRASVFTPNIPEAAQALGREILTANDMQAAAQSLLLLGMRSVLLKGGHLPASEAFVRDVFVQVDRPPRWFASARIAKKTHGTGCVLSALITAELAKGLTIDEAVTKAHAAFQHHLQHAIATGAAARASPDPFSQHY